MVGYSRVALIDRLFARGFSVFLLVLFAFASTAVAGEISCRAEVNRNSVPQGETVSLTVTAEGDVSWSADFQIPEISGVQIFGGGTNQSVAYINGQTMTTVAKSYFLRVDGEKDFTISSITISSDGQSCQTDPIAIKVTPAADPGGQGQIPPANTGNRTARPQAPATEGGQAAGRAGDDIFITLEADAQEVWLGQQVILSFKYFRRIQPWNNPRFTAPRTEGFWREDLGQERRYRSVVQGRTYNVTEIRYALFPTRSGDLVIEPAELAFPDQGLERFFSSRRRSGPKVLRTDPVTIRVKPLPEPHPDSFSGLVATRAELQGQIDRDTVPRGEPVSWKLQLVSDGFLKGFAGLNIPEPPRTRTHDAGENFATQVDNNHLLSAITVEKVIVPGEEGLLEVPPVELSWFDAGAGRYRLARAPMRRVMVNPSDLPFQPDEDSGFLRQEVSRLAQDLAFIHNVPDKVQFGSTSPFKSPLWWTGLALPLVLLLVWRMILARTAADKRDPAARRRRLALTQARKLLETARGSDDPVGIQAMVNRAISGFVADWNDLPPGAVGPAEVEDFCAQADAQKIGTQLRRIMDQSETSRFGGIGPDSTIAQGPDGLPAQVKDLLEILAGHCKASSDSHPEGKAASKPGATLGILALAGCLVLAGQPAVAQTDPARLMAEAGQAYTQGDLDQALGLYEEAVVLGVQDPVLFYNLGNTHARRGELGLAVVNYLRAQRLDPRDGDIARNLAWIRSHITDLELSHQDLPLFIAQLVWLARYLTVAEWSLVFLVFLWILAGLVAWGWYREVFSDGLRRGALLAGTLLVLSGAIFAWRYQGEEIRTQAVVIAQEISVHSGPAESFPVLFMIHDGLTVQVEGSQQGWTRISLGGESLGWIPEAGVLAVKSD